MKITYKFGYFWDWPADIREQLRRTNAREYGCMMRLCADRSGRHYTVIAQDENGKIVGWVSLLLSYDLLEAFMKKKKDVVNNPDHPTLGMHQYYCSINTYVRVPYRRKGIGSKLLKLAKRRLPRGVYYTVSKYYNVAESFYESNNL